MNPLFLMWEADGWANKKEEGTQATPCTRHMGERVLRFIAQVPKDGGSRTQVPEEEWLPCHRDHKVRRDTYGRLAWDRPSGVITSGCCNVSKGRFVHRKQDQALTPRETALLQESPPDTFFHGPLASIQHQIGNAVPPPLAEAFARVIRGCLEERSSAEPFSPAKCRG